MVTISAEVAQASEPLVRRLPRGDGLSPEPLIEVDDPRIASEAGRLRRQDAMGTARAVHDFVVAHVAYRGYAARERGAALALEEGSGDCSEMARLFVALARAAGVPARFVGGFMIDGSPLLTPTGYHDWAEFHDGRSWRIADPQQQVFDARYERYVTTRIAGPEVYETMTGAVRYRSRIGDLEVRMLGR
jgi:transglutaminase-like putative cysteine protease